MEPSFSQNLSKIADSMGIALYQRFTLSEASLFLRVHINEVKNFTKQKQIDFIKLGNKPPEFFGYQLLEYLLNNIQNKTPTRTTTNNNTPDRIIRAKEVQEITGLSRTTLWRMENKSEFPRRVSLGASSIGWRLSEINQWIQER